MIVSVQAIHVITFGLLAISFALIYLVRKQLLESTKNMQSEIDELKSNRS